MLLGDNGRESTLSMSLSFEVNDGTGGYMEESRCRCTLPFVLNLEGVIIVVLSEVGNINKFCMFLAYLSSKGDKRCVGLDARKKCNL